MLVSNHFSCNAQSLFFSKLSKISTALTCVYCQSRLCLIETKRKYPLACATYREIEVFGVHFCTNHISTVKSFLIVRGQLIWNLVKSSANLKPITSSFLHLLISFWPNLKEFNPIDDYVTLAEDINALS